MKGAHEGGQRYEFSRAANASSSHQQLLASSRSENAQNHAHVPHVLFPRVQVPYGMLFIYVIIKRSEQRTRHNGIPYPSRYTRNDIAARHNNSNR